MWRFKKQPPEVDLTNEAYARYLRANWKESLSWFLSLSEGEQETLAMVGDEYQNDLFFEMGAGFAAAFIPPTDTEEAQVLSMLGSSPGEAVQSARPPGMAGVTKRREEASGASDAHKNATRTLFGRPPDEATG
jgi:hypothetical protein